tara:strand:- start:242 stop:676 length:435 start_codon:yes stop_codon:yes gene_type:complete
MKRVSWFPQLISKQQEFIIEPWKKLLRTPFSQIRQVNKNQCLPYSSDVLKMTVEGHIPKLDRPCKPLPDIYETATEKVNMTPQEWKAFFYLSEYPAPANQKRYLRDGIPMTFFEFEEKYGNFADSMWESASIHEPYYVSEDDLY